MKKISAIFGRFLLVVMGLLLPILILEIGVRLLGLAPPPIPNPNIWEMNPELGWRHIPNSGGVFYSSYNEYQNQVDINSMGLRDNPTLNSYDLPESKFKLLILADSFGEALQIPLEKTFFKGVQRRLNNAGVETQSINAGVGNWGTDQEATFYRLEGRKYHPDLTLLFFFTRNDANNNYKPLEAARNGGSIQKSFYHLDEAGKLHYPQAFDPETAYSAEYPKPATLPPAPWLKTADWLWLHSALYRWLLPYLRDIPPIVKSLGPSGILGGEGRIRAVHPSTPVPFYVYQTPMPAEWRNAWALTEAIIADLKAQVEADGGKFALVIIPAKEQVYPKTWERTVQANPSMQALNWNLELPNQQLARIAGRQDIPILDLLPVFQQALQQPNAAPFYFKHDGHWNENGHRLAAQAVFEFLRQEKLTN